MAHAASDIPEETVYAIMLPRTESVLLPELVSVDHHANLRPRMPDDIPLSSCPTSPQHGDEDVGQDRVGDHRRPVDSRNHPLEYDVIVSTY